MDITQKICTQCKYPKLLSDFSIGNSSLGRSNKCKKCKSEYYELNKNEIIAKSNAYYQKNKERIRVQAIERRKNKATEYNAKKREYYKTEKGGAAIKRYTSDKLKNDLQFKLRHALRTRLNKAIKRGLRESSAVRDLGCTIDQLKQHLESKFQSGMTWNNWGRTGWHIDHIKPLASFDLTDREQLLQAVNYTNLQPLWWKDNLEKKKKDFLYEKTI